jgi:tetratricopeptide (TPR) repeat protein
MSKLATAVCSLLVVAGLANAQSDLRSGPYVLGGMVMTPHSRMNGDFEVRLLNNGDVPVGSLRTFAETQFSFRGLAPGVYYVEIDVSGFRAVRERVDLVDGQFERNIPIMLEAQSQVIQSSGSSGDDDDVVDIADITRSPKILKQFKEATKKLQSGDLSGARTRLESLIAADPDFYEAHRFLGAAYQQSRLYREAEKEYMVARMLKPLSATPLIHLGSLYLEEVEAGTTSSVPPQDLLEKGRDVLLKAVQLNSGGGVARYLLGVTYYKLGHYSDSESSLLRALDLEPRLANIRLALANVYMRVQDWSKALTHLDTYLKENPKAADRELVVAKRAQIEGIFNRVKNSEGQASGSR